MKTKENEFILNNNINESCFWEFDLYTGKLYWSDEFCQLLGFTKPYTPTLEQLIYYYQPEKNLRATFNRAIHQGLPFELELPVLSLHQKVIMVYTTGHPVYDDYGKCIAIKGNLQSEQDENSAQLLPFIPENVEEQHLMLENFARIISHNLRSHTSNLQMVLETVNRKTSTKEMRGLIGNIKTISSNLNQTVGYLNTLIKI
ncbi:MAG: PAS domain-containing protein [Janthinobacterium lividum]